MAAPDSSAPVYTRPLNVLVVEDDSDVVPLIDRGLRAIHAHYSLSWTSDAQGARKALRSQEFDLVIADYTLDGGGTGWSLLQEVRQTCPDAQVGLVSALPLGVQRVESRFLRKPFSQAELISFLRPLVEKCELAGLPAGAPSLAAQPRRRRSAQPSRAQHRSR
jgi:DNA-binding response OmpR family regulator